MNSVLNFLRFSGKLEKTNLGVSSLKISHFVGFLIKCSMLADGKCVCVCWRGAGNFSMDFFSSFRITVGFKFSFYLFPFLHSYLVRHTRCFIAILLNGLGDILPEFIRYIDNINSSIMIDRKI